MRRADRKRWQAATTLADLGELTAQWLEGTIRSHPCQASRGGPSDETSDLVPALAQANRAGFVTHQSQPGCSETVDDGTLWEQRAFVEAFTDTNTMRAVTDAGIESGLLVYAYLASRSWFPAIRRGSATVVTINDGSPFTVVGHQFSRRFLHGSVSPFVGCNDAAIDRVCDAWQVTIVDPAWGRNDVLWPLLDQLANQETTTEPTPVFHHHNHPGSPA